MVGITQARSERTSAPKQRRAQGALQAASALQASKRRARTSGQTESARSLQVVNAIQAGKRQHASARNEQHACGEHDEYV
jgi:hypothetical protein